MKKTSLLFVSIFTMLLGVFLAACDFKEPRADFNTEEVVMSVDDTLNIGDYLSVSEIELSDVEFRFSNSSVASMSEQTLVAQSSGQSVIYAFYNNNRLDSMRVIVKKDFESVTNIQMSDDGLVTWNIVSDKLDDSFDFVSPTNYRLQITYLNEDTNEENSTTEIVSTNSYQLSGYGRYTISVSAVGTGYFEDSTPIEATFYYGYMPKISVADFSFNKENNTLSWSIESWKDFDKNVAEFSVEFNGNVIATSQTATNIDLTSYLATLDAGDYTLAVTTADKDGNKISVESDEIIICKVDNAVVENSFSRETGGLMNFTLAENSSKVVAKLGEDYSFDIASNGTSSFNGVAEGVYALTVQSIARDLPNGNVFYANGNVVEVGNIYKLGAATISGAGENEENSTTFNYNLTRTSTFYETNLYTSLSQTVTALDTGFTFSESQIARELTVPNSGEYSLIVYNYAAQAQINAEGQNCYAINSDASNALIVTKLPAFSNVTGDLTIGHHYDENNSVLTFNIIDFATNYLLYAYNGTGYTVINDELYSYDSGAFTFNGKIEDVLQTYFVGESIQFKIVAVQDDETLYIPSSTTTTLTVLETPNSDDGGDGEVVYAWQPVEYAGQYVVSYAAIDKDTYDAGLDSISLDDEALTTETVSGNSIVLDAGSYYYIEITALPEDENLYLTSEVFRAIFFITEQLQTPVVQFGYNEEYLGDITDASGYFLEVTNVDNMGGLTVLCDEMSVSSYSTGEDSTIFLLTNPFTSVEGVNISVVATPTDSVIYLNSAPYDFTVYKLASVVYRDLIFDEATSTMTVSGGRTGVSSILMQEVGNENNKAETISSSQDANLIITNFTTTPTDVTIELFGSEFQNNYYTISNGSVYIESDVSTFTLKRLTAPNSLDYMNGLLTFSNDESEDVNYEYFVLDIIITDGNSNQNIIKVKFDTTLRIEVNGVEEEIQEAGDLLQDVGNEGDTHNYQIDFDALLEILGQNSVFSNAYSQANEVGFAVYSYRTVYQNPYIWLSSSYANCFDDVESQVLTIEKMPSPVISYNKSTSYLSWAEAGQQSENTTYVIYDRTDGGQIELSTNNSSTSYFLDLSGLELSKRYQYTVVATNPYYLDSAESNIISIYKLSQISSVQVVNNTLQFIKNSLDVNYIASTRVQIDENEATNIQNETVTLSGAGVYYLQQIGTDAYETSQGLYIIDSATSSFNVHMMSDLAPANSTISFANNTVSFANFGENANLQTLKYLIVFVSSEGTAQAEVNTNSYVIDLANSSLNDLPDGAITINVYALLDNYSVSAGGNVYYNSQITLANNESRYNAYAYTVGDSINKLSSPSIDKIDFIYEGEENAQRPTLQVTISGNYSNDETIYLYFGDYEDYVVQISCQDAESEGNYVIDIPFDSYSDFLTVGENTVISAVVTSSINLPSNAGMAEIYRNEMLSSITHNVVDDEFEGVSYQSQVVTITFADIEALNMAAGGLYLHIIYTPTGGMEQEQYILISSDNYGDLGNFITYDLTNFFATNMTAGGSVAYEVFVNNYSGDRYCLSSESLTSADYVINQRPESGTSLTLVSGGIQIGTSINTANTFYVVQYGTEKYIVDSESDFYFEYPSSWGSGTYDLTITAYENGKIVAVPTTVQASITRLESVQNVTLTRDADDVTDLILSWDSVANADSYIVRVFALGEEDVMIGDELIVRATSVSLINDFFGENYDILAQSYFTTGANLRIEIIACSDNSAYNNSPIKEVSTQFTANTISPSYDFNLTEYSELYFNSVAETTYLYRIVSTSGTPYIDWTEVTAASENVVIDLSEVSINANELFRVQVMLKGNITTDGLVYNDDAISFVLDSAYVQSEQTFMLTPAVVNIYSDDANIIDLALALESEVENIYVSQNSKFVPDEVFAIDIVYTNMNDDGGNLIYYIDVTDILDNYNITNNTTLYFFAQQVNEATNYVISKAFEYELNVDTSAYEFTVEKVTSEDANDALINTYLVFDQDGSISGFNLKIEQLSYESGEATAIATAKVSLNLLDCQSEHFADQLAINLTEILAREGVDVYSGDVKVYISVVKDISEVDAETKTYAFSPYITDCGDRELIFSKIPEVNSIYLSNGDLAWSTVEGSDDLISKYYIYVYDASNSDNFEIYTTETNAEKSYSGLNFNVELNTYNMAVQCISDDPYVISSNARFILDEAGQRMPITKARVNSPIQLSNSGNISIDWNALNIDSTLETDYSNDIYKLLSSTSMDGTLANYLVSNTFYYPFTFTLEDLVNNRVIMRFRFTSYSDDAQSVISSRRSVDVSAMYILASLLVEDSSQEELEAKLLDIRNNYLTDTLDQALIDRFISALNNIVGGVGNYVNIFDSLFERIQTGNYKIEYCLLGGTQTLTSVWYTLTKDVDDSTVDTFRVAATPTVTASYDEIEGEATRAYYVRINEVMILDNVDGEIVETPATTYVMQLSTDLGKMGIEISTVDGSTWQCTIINNGEYEDITPFTVTKDAESNCLLLYFNMNDGNSLMGAFKDYIAKGDYTFQIYAQGNEYTLSGKSSAFNLSFYSSCSSFRVENGVFTWVSYQNNPVNVVYKHVDVNSEQTLTVNAGAQSVARFSLEGLAIGEYEYIKFYTAGGITGNRINVDSEVYVVNNVFKLDNPTVGISLNNITITDNNNDDNYANGYSEDGFMKYQIYNNVSTQNSSFTFQPNSTSATYEAGTTGYEVGDADYAYKQTELSATSFSVASLGTTITSDNMLITLDEADPSNNTYILSYTPIEEGLSGNICVRSESYTINASMLGAVEDVSISDGIVTWTSDNVLGENTLPQDVSTLFSIKLKFYNIQNGDTNYLIDEIVRYTARHYFDISSVESDFPENDFTYIEITIQALALQTSSTSMTNGVTLIEGGYAYGNNITYSGTTRSILRSNGSILTGVSFTPSVENVEIIDGKLTWTYSGSGEVDFIVQDAEGNEIDGVCTTDEISGRILFNETEGAISAGTQTLYVYAVAVGSGTSIKSRAVTIQVNKLSPILDTDYSITKDTLADENLEVEILDFANYFANQNAGVENVRIDMNYSVTTMVGGEEVARENTIELSAIASKVAILSTTYNGSNELMRKYGFAAVLVIEDQMSFEVMAYQMPSESGEETSTTTPVLNSDIRILDLIRPVNDYDITWDEESQKFTWQIHVEEGEEGEVVARDEGNLVYVARVTYKTGQNDDAVFETRTYELSTAEFTPTIISEVKLELAIKSGQQGLQSIFTTYMTEDGYDYVDYNLFESGNGTSSSPYIIVDGTQFKNIQYRMQKSSEINSYTDEDGTTVDDESAVYYFNITSDIDISAESFEGILFKGVFTGVISGRQSSGAKSVITYSAENVATLTSNIEVRVGQVVSVVNLGTSTTYSAGAGLFEILSAGSSISNLTIIPTISGGTSNVTQNAIIAGLAVANNGEISSVEVQGLNTNLVVNSARNSLVGVYAGLVGINNSTGSISSSSFAGNISLTDGGVQQNFFIGGLCFTNYGRLTSNNLNGNINLNLQYGVSSTNQIAGIVVTSTGTLSGNTVNESSTITVSASSSTNSHVVYAAGIAVYARGTVNNDQAYTGCVSVTNISEGNAHTSDGIYN